MLQVHFGCNRNDPSREINVKKNEIAGNDQTGAESGEDILDSKSSDENSTLQKITSKEVKQHIGDSLRITGYIADVYLGEKVAYLNFENRFPKNVFSCTIFQKTFNEFGDLSKYKNKTAEVTGKITTYKNKPQVILESKQQIKIIQ